MTDVFVSYASRDREIVRRLVSVLETVGYRVWWDRAIEPGQRFDRSIHSALDQAAAVVVVWTRNSVDSDWVRWEAGEALARRRLVPVRGDDARLPGEFLRHQTLDVRRFLSGDLDPDDAVGRLCHAVARLVESHEPSDHPAESPADEPFLPASDLGSRPMIGVMPFVNQSADVDYDYFADGISEDLVHALSRWRLFPVVAYSATAGYRDVAWRAVDVATELGVSFLVSGKVRRAGNRIRVTAELVDAGSGRQIWHESLTSDLDDFFNLQDELSARIAWTVQPRLVQEAKASAQRKRPADMSAWDLALRAHVEWTAHTRESNLRARDLARRALELDPDSTFARVTLAESYYLDIFYQWSDDLSRSLESYCEEADRALASDQEDANANVQKGVSLILRQQPQQAASYLQTAVDLNPSQPLARTMLGQLQILQGDPATGIPHLLEAVKVKTGDPGIWGEYGALALGCFAAGDYAECIGWAQRCQELRPQLALSWALAAASAAALGSDARAQVFVAGLRRHHPQISAFELMFVLLGATEEIRNRFVDLLERAGYRLADPGFG